MITRTFGFLVHAVMYSLLLLVVFAQHRSLDRLTVSDRLDWTGLDWTGLDWGFVVVVVACECAFQGATRTLSRH